MSKRGNYSTTLLMGLNRRIFFFNGHLVSLSCRLGSARIYLQWIRSPLQPRGSAILEKQNSNREEIEVWVINKIYPLRDCIIQTAKDLKRLKDDSEIFMLQGGK